MACTRRRPALRQNAFLAAPGKTSRPSVTNTHGAVPALRAASLNISSGSAPIFTGETIYDRTNLVEWSMTVNRKAPLPSILK